MKPSAEKHELTSSNTKHSVCTVGWEVVFDLSLSLIKIQAWRRQFSYFYYMMCHSIIGVFSEKKLMCNFLTSGWQRVSTAVFVLASLLILVSAQVLNFFS